MKHLLIISSLFVMSVNAQSEETKKAKIASEAQAPKASFANERDKDGNFLGVKLVKIEEMTSLTNLGVKAGDIVISIEGRQVTSLSDFVKRFEPVFANSKQLSFQVVRGDLRLQFTFEPESR